MHKVIQCEKYDDVILIANDTGSEDVRNSYVDESGSTPAVIIVNTETLNGKNLCSTSTERGKDDVGHPSEQEQHYSEDACVPSDDCMSKKDSDDELTENESKPEEYLFPTPDEMENTSTPEVGKVFSSLEEAVRFVNIYAHISGFGIKKGRNYRNRKITICCCKSRKTEPNAAGVRKRRRNVVVRTNCQMHVTVSLQDGRWIITSQDLAHNHDLVCSPTLTKFFLSHRSMNEAEKLLSRLLQEHRIKPRKIMSIFRKLSGGKLGNITFDVKKLDNLKQEDREKRRNTDIEHTLEYIEKLQIDKPGFVYKAQRNASNSMLSLFWTDSRSRLDYLLFGDIISFDTTFSTNKYNMPFARLLELMATREQLFLVGPFCRMSRQTHLNGCLKLLLK
ncbi:protein FAR1-RELATED SEQUENCE 5-like isoform X2 [Triticum dicoccoides]|uniref:protein FAR1-RELATED SEQUENCE 5-like isoform X2 n=1 Tax=Triticum dicoccoides TaxID=85692 RepID=UPI0018901DEA|nr:protein FAR1-RELATED SEQUENCE 5-like isoform X2 [Triticum dicoccoides]